MVSHKKSNLLRRGEWEPYPDPQGRVHVEHEEEPQTRGARQVSQVPSWGDTRTIRGMEARGGQGNARHEKVNE